MQFTQKQRDQIEQESVGKVIARVDWDEDYWTMTFTDGTEMSFRFMAELV